MGYTIHHLNCGTLCTGDNLLLKPFAPAHLSCHCLLVEGKNGLILIDTGFGLNEVQRPNLLGQAFRKIAKPVLSEKETAVRQIEALGFKASDVTDIIVTHLHLDHAGGIADFPSAKVHAHRLEYQVAQMPETNKQKMAYLRHQWRHAQWQLHDVTGERWFGFEAVRPLDAQEDILLIPLEGHSRGHSGIAVKGKDRWYLHCGDAYFDQKEIHPTHPSGSLGMRLYEELVQDNKTMRVRNRNRLRELNKTYQQEVRLFCSHDYSDYCKCAGIPESKHP